MNAPGDWYSGHIQLTDDGAEFAIIASSPQDAAGKWTDDPNNHQVVFGITEAGTVLARIRTRTQSTTRGGYAVRVVRWKAAAVLMDVNDDDVDSDTVARLSLHYYGVGSWAGLNHADHEPIQDGERGPVIGWRIEARRVEDRTVSINDDFAVTLGAHLSPAGTPDKLAIHTPLVVRITSTERRPFEEHLQHLDGVHALLSLAHRDPVAATYGYARLNPGDEHSDTRLWDRTMMGIGHHHENVNLFPVFTLDDIGGPDGVAAWLRTCQTHWRSVTPLVKHRLFGNQTPESRLLSTAAAMENWVASHRRCSDWAKKKDGRDTIALAMVRSVAPAWSDWIGESDAWVAEFTDSYRSLKHIPDAEVDVDVVDALEFAGRWLLAASILDECAGTSAPSHQIFSRGLAYPAGKRIREVLGLEPKSAD